MNLKSVGNIVGIIVGLAIVSVVAARPQFLDITFKGFQGLIGQATLPVTGKK